MLTNPNPITDLIRGRDDWRALLEQDYQATSRRLQGAYNALLPDLRRRLGDVTEAMTSADTPLTPQQVRELPATVQLIERIDAEMDGFARLTRVESGQLSDQAIGRGGDAALGMAAAQVRDPRLVTGGWMRPDPAALAQLVDYADGEAMRARAASFGVNAADNFSNTLLALTAQGKGTREITRRMTQWFQLPYAWADNQVRTAQIWSYRVANHANYRANSDVVRAWMWRAALDPRTCMSCIAQHGSVHPNEETLNDHHRGRCGPIPIVKGTTWANEVESGEQWFSRQPADRQRQMMGPGLFEAWRRGDVRFADLSRPYEDGVYGTMLRQASLRELGVRPRPPSRQWPPPAGALPAAPRPAAPIVPPRPRGANETEVRALERDLLGYDVEHLAGWNAQGQRVAYATGTRDSVSLSQSEWEALRGGVVTHNHPRVRYQGQVLSTSFSVEDFALATRFDLQQMRAVATSYQGQDHLHVFRPPAAGWSSVRDNWGNFARDYTTLYNQRATAMEARIRAGESRRDVEQWALDHGIWQDLAGRYGFGYERSAIED